MGNILNERDLTPERIFGLWDKSRNFNESVGLYDTVKTNEDFFIGKQWEGVRSNGLPTPVFNILKRDVCFVVSTITTDSLKVQVSPLGASGREPELALPAQILTQQLEAAFEENDLGSLLRQFARDAAVRGDGCIYTWWEPGARAGGGAMGAVRSEILENTRVHFGNPSDRNVQSQPYIILERRQLIDRARAEARENGIENWEDISPDEDRASPGAERRDGGDKVTELMYMWRDDEDSIWGYKCTRDSEIRRPWNMGVELYPIVWLNWDYVSGSYHGQAMITGLIPNQIFINKLWAMSMLSLMTTAYPKIIYDSTRIERWTNQIGQAIGVAGGDMGTAARAITPAQMSPQAAQFIELAIEQTNRNLGATDVSLGDARPDNTSAIVALQRAAATPSELTRQNLYKCVEDLSRIYAQFMAGFYGRRGVRVPTPENVRQAAAFAGEEPPESVPGEFDFAELRDMPMDLKLEVGASSYYSEIAAIQTLDNLLSQGKITAAQYLRRIPDGYVPDRRGLIRELEEAGTAGTPNAVL